MANQELPPQVAFALGKLKRNENYNNLDQEELVRKAYNLTDPDYIRGMFSYLFDTARRLISELAGKDDNELLRTLEMKEAHDKAKHGVAQACHLPIRLLLSKLRWRMPTFINRLSSLLSLEYGALHSALQVGEVVIEWGRGSIVDPQMVEYVPQREFQAQIGNQGDWFQRAHELTRDMSLADRRHNSEEKLNVLFRSAAEKHQLLENLVAVIVDYNGSRDYSVFSCNCQHFVHDALTALGIKNTPQFSGMLDDYLKHLKVGVKSVPKDLDTHEKLDRYVADSLDNLTPHDMEYLLCQYFKHHLAEMEKDLDNWACTLATCQADKLEERIKEQTLVFNRFKREEKRLPPPHDDRFEAIQEEDSEGDQSSSSSSSSSSNDEDEGFKLPKELAGGISLRKQHSLLNKFSGYRENVTTKLRNHPFYDKAVEVSQVDFLSEREKFRDKYLSNLIDRPTEEIVLQTTFDSEVFSFIPQDEAKRRLSERFRALYDFPVKLCLRVSPNDARPLKSKSIEDAPLKAGLIVGEYLYEWDKTGLVFPKRVTDVLSSQPTLQIGLLKHSGWFTFVEKLKREIDFAIECLDYDTFVQLAYKLTEKKDQLMFALIDQVMDYNRHYEYQYRGSNDRCFVLEAMKALGIKTPFPLHYTLKRHMKSLKQSKIIKKLESHIELDTRLLEMDRNIGLVNLSKQEVNFLATHYFLFHLKSWVELDCPSPWTCSQDTCQLTFLQRECDVM